jgi:hypothetical protein
MKQFWMACALALPLAALPQQSASAWGGDFTTGGGLNWWYTIGCKPACCSGPAYGGESLPAYAGGATDGYAPGCGGVAYSWGGYPGTYYGWGQAPALTPAPAPTQMAQYPPATGYPYGFQPVSYSSAPSYWYGR